MLYTLAVILLIAWLLGLGGVYAIELTAGSGGATERRRLTFMMK